MSLKQDAGIFDNTDELPIDALDALADIYREFSDEVMVFTTDEGTMFLIDMVIHVNEIASMDDEGEVYFDWDMLKKNYPFIK